MSGTVSVHETNFCIRIESSEIPTYSMSLEITITTQCALNAFSCDKMDSLNNNTFSHCFSLSDKDIKF